MRALSLTVVVSVGIALATDTFIPENQSKCFGSISNGRLENGVLLPISGENFSTYSKLGSSLGRTCVHDKVYSVLLESWQKLASLNPDVHYVYGETGWCNGGPFKPHKTHQNGLVVDFMVPLRTSDGKSLTFNGSISNRFGYDMRFSSDGTREDKPSETVDFVAMSSHLRELNKATKDAGLSIKKVIFAPDMQHNLAADVQRGIRFSRTPVWIRHDNHYHVEFAGVSCGAI